MNSHRPSSFHARCLSGKNGKLRRAARSAVESLESRLLFSDTYLPFPSPLTGNTELSDTSHPYLLSRGTTVPAGVTLTLDPGVTLVTYPATLSVAGSLVAKGAT